MRLWPGDAEDQETNLFFFVPLAATHCALAYRHAACDDVIGCPRHEWHAQQRRVKKVRHPATVRLSAATKGIMFLASFGSGAQARPSFFEMVAQQEMMPRLQPALKHILLVRYSCFGARIADISVGGSTEAP